MIAVDMNSNIDCTKTKSVQSRKDELLQGDCAKKE